MNPRLNSKLASWLGAIGACLSLFAIADLPYAYYTFNRVALTCIAITMIIIAVQVQAVSWLFALVPVAVLWNPAIPFYLDRSTWLPLNLLAAILLFAGGLALASKAGKLDTQSSADIT